MGQSNGRHYSFDGLKQVMLQSCLFFRFFWKCQFWRIYRVFVKKWRILRVHEKGHSKGVFWRMASWNCVVNVWKLTSFFENLIHQEASVYEKWHPDDSLVFCISNDVIIALVIGPVVSNQTWLRESSKALSCGFICALYGPHLLTITLRCPAE